MNQTIGHYEIVSEIGRGGMATVYLAYDPRFKPKRKVALKLLPNALSQDENFRSRFIKEAQIIASLEHFAIVPIYDFGEENGQLYFVMRLMSGKSLANRIASGPLPLDEISRYLSRIAQGLDAAHAKNIIHRDLKPGNILFDEQGELYLADFGIAKKREIGGSLTGSAVIGTPAYMSPEQGQGNREIDWRSDIYSLGVVLFEMLTGRVPYISDNPWGQVVMHITAPIPDVSDYRPDLPPGMELVIQKAMDKQKIRRYATASELAEAFRALVEGPNLLAQPGVSNQAAADKLPTPRPSKPIGASQPQEKTPSPKRPTPAAGQKNEARSTPPHGPLKLDIKRPTPPPKNPTVAARRPSPLPYPTLSNPRMTPPAPMLVDSQQAADASQPSRLMKVWWFIPVGVLLLAAAILAGLAFGGMLTPGSASSTSTLEVSQSTSLPLVQPDQDTPIPTGLLPGTDTPVANTPIPSTPTFPPQPSPTSVETATSSPSPGPVVIGGADKLGFISAGDIYVINLDGSDLKRLTSDGGLKTGLNWSPDGASLFFINGTCVYQVDIQTAQVRTILCANWTAYLASFEISPDGKYAALSISEGLFILPYDLNLLGQIRRQDQLMSVKACLVYTERKTKQVRWSHDSTHLAMVVTVTLGGQVVEIIQELEFLPCGSAPIRAHEFPTTSSVIRNYAKKPYIESFGWDGDTLFALNIPALNNFGDFYLYNTANLIWRQVKPFNNLCCFRDFTWSPDNSHILFAFQNNNFGKDTQLFYIPYNSLEVNTSPQPLPIPAELLSDPNVKPRAVLRPAKNAQP